jgi:hypothetical protein
MRTQFDQGSRTDIIRSADFVADHLIPTLNGFYVALARRWQRLVAETIVSGGWDYPTRIVRPGAPYLSPIEPPDEWAFSSEPARLHIDTGSCLTLHQVRRQEYDPENVASCPGAVLPEPGVNPGDAAGAAGEVPQYIDCRVRSLLQEVVNWAWAERGHLLEQLLLFDHHDLDALEQAHDDLMELGDQLTLNRYRESGGDGVELGLSDLGVIVSQIAVQSEFGMGWWDEWTGLLATTVKEGFFSSVAPTLNNQSVIAGYLADLYSNRATIINAGRNNVLRAVQQATEALDRTRVVVTQATPYWKAVQGVGGLVAISGGWSGAGAAVGATVVALGYIGEQLDLGATTRVEYAGDMISIVHQLNDQARSISTEIEGFERDYDAAVAALVDGVNTVHSFNLELYDHTRNNPEGTPDDRAGFTAKVDAILRLAERCYQAGESYAGLLPAFGRIAEADRHLAGADGTAAWGDRKVVEMRDLLESFLRTTAGRYLGAGDMVKDAADAYADTDAAARRNFDRSMRKWSREEAPPDEVNVPFRPGEYAEETDRDIDPFQDPRAPRLADGDGYRVEPDGGGAAVAPDSQ